MFSPMQKKVIMRFYQSVLNKSSGYFKLLSLYNEILCAIGQQTQGENLILKQV